MKFIVKIFYTNLTFQQELKDGYWIGAYKNPGFVARAMSRDPLKHIAWEPYGEHRSNYQELMRKPVFKRVR